MSWFGVGKKDDDVVLEFESVVRETDMAWLILFEDDNSAWMPKSKCTIDMTTNSITAPTWLAKEKELV